MVAMNVRAHFEGLLRADLLTLSLMFRLSVGRQIPQHSDIELISITGAKWTNPIRWNYS